MTSILQKVLDAFNKPDVLKIKNPEEVEKILEDMVKAGPGELQVITDFDMTLTRYHKDGERCETCHGILENSSLMADEFKQKSRKLYSKYYPIEIDHELTIAEKIPYMVEWYEKSHETITAYPLNRQDIKAMVANARLLFRDNTVEMLRTLNDAHVPVMVFSAGVGDILEEALRKNESYYPNTKVVSNMMEFDSKGQLIGFKGPLIHMYNKNESAIRQSEPNYFEDLTHRPNVILMGDSLGDVDMVEGVPNPGAIFKIGFLNTNIDERLQSFMDAYDVVLIDDQSVDFVNLVLQHVLKSQQS